MFKLLIFTILRRNLVSFHFTNLNSAAVVAYGEFQAISWDSNFKIIPWSLIAFSLNHFMSLYLWNLNQLGPLFSAEFHKVVQHINDINEFPCSKHYALQVRFGLVACTTPVYIYGIYILYIYGSLQGWAALPSPPCDPSTADGDAQRYLPHVRTKGTSVPAGTRVRVLESRASRSRGVILALSCALVRLHLQCWIHLWGLQHKTDMDLLVWVQRTPQK